ncbi:DNA polymerase kappa isoform X1 [Phodopus roborovskii]|uniref:DNA polymerase kappa n=1 Tax=Phodopus roborovskii TaxID=109678 RepID=A0AAU9Z4T8_PHORO|nr:DNA polymerase kappa isoform X1 [Phodopus roborovskii]CAH6787547.1 Polk [Phodopus roborovskii]
MDNTKEKNNCKDDLLLRMGLNDNKAGMEGLDKEKINKIIMDATKGSRFYGNELKKEKQVNQRIESMMQQKAQITSQQLRKAQLQVDRLAMDLERNRNLNNTIVHVDMDAFYAAVEMRDNPELKDKPIAVGSMSMLSTSNYHARRFGVRAAMPGFIAKRLCPQLIIVPPNFDKYRAVSKEVKEILAEYDPNFMAVSLDEAYLNITQHLEERQSWPEDKRRYFSKTGNPIKIDKPGEEANRLSEDEQPISPLLFEDSPPDLQPHGNPFQLNPEERNSPQTLQNSVVFGTSAEEVVKEIRFRIEQKTTLTASAGIAPNTMLAKVCSDKNKPNGQYQIPPSRKAVMDFIKDLPIRKVSGIGKVTEKMLMALGIVTCMELYQQRALLSLLFSETSWHYFLHIALGLGSTNLARDGERKSMSVERTFSEISNTEEQYSLCQELCTELAHDLQKEGLKGRTVTVKLKNVDFEVKTRASTVLSTLSTAEEIFAVAKELLRTEVNAASPHPLRLRLMGVRISTFSNKDAKKHQQRGIIGFLQAGQRALSSPGCSVDRIDKTEFVKPSEIPHKKSFFDKKRSERLSNHQDTPRCEVVNQRALQTSQPFRAFRKMRESLETSENSNNCQTFTCPVCFREQEGVSLEAFNEHVDACLDGPSTSEDSKMPSYSQASSTAAGQKEDASHSIPPCEHCDYEDGEVESVDGADGAETVGQSLTAVSADTTGSNHSKEEHSDAPDQSCPIPLANEAVRMLSEQESIWPCTDDVVTGQALVCPVCNLEQKTSDLTLFNVHVDICLNKGIIQELRNNEANSVSQPKESSRSAGRLQKAAGRTKRLGQRTKWSTSKKTKPQSPRHTLDVFFK